MSRPSVFQTATTWQLATGGRDARPGGDDEQVEVRGILRDRRFAIFLCGSVMVAIVFFQQESSLPLYLVQYLHMSPAFYGILITINTLLIVALEVPLNTATAKWPNTWSLIAGCLLFAIGFGALGFVSSPLGIVPLVVVWTFGEMMLLPAMGAHLAEVAPDSLRGTYMGAFSMSLSLALTLGPWMGIQLLAATGPTRAWSVMFAIAVFAALLMVYAVPPHLRSRVVGIAEF